ncbi:MAG: glycosyltransferase family 39 protein [Anaerolineae bacterium]|nr:glycosyltransferase family 39 protein [Candidatus Roseilinea sp.]MDW8451571.1 glycosyltransferase family 39 protein [Anaerolineae bacterium]
MHSLLRDRTALRSFLALVLSGALYFGIALVNLGLPGLNYDEAADAIPALELLRGEWPASALKTIRVFDQPVPIMMLHYIGPTSIYTSLAGFTLFGVSVESLRLTQTLIGLLTLILIWTLARTWFDERVAALAVALAATAPVFVWWHRAGAFFSSPMLPIALSTVLLLTMWQRAQRSAPLIAACFLFGLGCTTKLLFVWLLGPIALTALIGLSARETVARLRALSPATLVGCAAAFALGLAPFVIHNIPELDSFRFIAQNAIRSQLYGHDNLDILNNTAFQAMQLFRLVGGDTLEFNAPAPPLLAGVALVASLIYTSVWLWRNRGNSMPTRLPRLFLLLSVAVITPLATFSVTAIGGRHLFILTPFVILLIASVLADGLRTGMPHWVRIATAMATLALVVNGMIGNLVLLRFLEQTGGRGLWSDALNRVATLLESDFAGRPVVAMDWGFERNIALLTQGRVRMREAYEYTRDPSPRFTDTSLVLLREPNNVYLFHSPETTAFGGHWERFERAALKSRMQLVQVAALHERDGVTNTLIYVAKPAPRTFTTPALAEPRNAMLSSGAELIGGDVRYDPARREVSVMLYWRALADALPDDTVLLHIVNQATGEVVLAADTQPVYGAYPFPQWQRGEVVTDPHWVALPEGLPPGTYQVRVGAYDPQTGQRRAIADPRNDAAGDSLMLQTFEVN